MMQKTPAVHRFGLDRRFPGSDPIRWMVGLFSPAIFGPPAQALLPLKPTTQPQVDCFWWRIRPEGGSDTLPTAVTCQHPSRR